MPCGKLVKTFNVTSVRIGKSAVGAIAKFVPAIVSFLNLRLCPHHLALHGQHRLAAANETTLLFCYSFVLKKLKKL
jgi:hypothetical protein